MAGTPQATSSYLPEPQASMPSGKAPQTPRSGHTFLALTADDLTAITQGIVRAQQLIHGGGGDKEPKFADQLPFSGKVEDQEPLIREAEIRFSVMPKDSTLPPRKPTTS